MRCDENGRNGWEVLLYRRRMTSGELDADAIRRWKAEDPEQAGRFERWLVDAVGQPLKGIESVRLKDRHGQTVLTVVHRALNQRDELRPGDHGAMHTRTVRLTVGTPPPVWPAAKSSPSPWPPPAWPPET